MADTSSEQRAMMRTRILKHAMVVSKDKFSTAYCKVRDFSETGALLQIDTPELVPAEGILRLPDGGGDFPYQVDWRRDDQIGVLFVEALSEEAPRPTLQADAPPQSFAEQAKARLREKLNRTGSI